MVIVPPDQWADTPAGNPFAPDTPSLAMPVAPVVVCVIVGDRAVLTHKVGVEDATVTVLVGLTVIVAVPVMKAGVQKPLTPLIVKL